MPDVLTDNLVKFLDENPVGTLGVKRKDGRIHQSLVNHLVLDGKVYISSEPTRVKGRAIIRDGWASYAVRGAGKPYPSFTLEGPAVFLQGEGTGELTTKLFEKIFGKPLDEPLSDDAVHGMNRGVIEITPENVYAVSYVEV